MNTSANINVSSVNGALTQNKIESREKANNSDTDSDTLKELSTHEDFYVRRAVATHYNTPTTALSSLASDAEEQIRFYLEMCIRDRYRYSSQYTFHNTLSTAPTYWYQTVT